MPATRSRTASKPVTEITVLSRQPFKSKNRLQSSRPNSFTNRRLDSANFGPRRRPVNLNVSGSVEYLHFKEEVSNYGHLSDSPLPITPWHSLEEFEEIMDIIYNSVYEVPKQLPPGCQPEHLHELFIRQESRDKVVYARLKVRTWKLRSMNIDDAQFLTEFLICLERLLDYLIAKSFQRQRLAPLLNVMKTMVVTGFITSLEQTLAKQNFHFLGRSLRASKLFSCAKWILQIRHKLSHSNTQVSGDTLEDAISFIFAWFRGNFEFHLKKMPSDSYEGDKEFYQHRSFSNNHFNHGNFRHSLADLFYGKLEEAEEENFLRDLRHFSRFDLNKFLCFLVQTIDTILVVKKEAPDFDFFIPAIRKFVKGIFMDTRSDVFCLKFLNKLLDQIVKYEGAIEKTNKPEEKLLFGTGRDRLYNFMYMFVRTITGKNTTTKHNFFHIYLTQRKSDCLRWSKFSFRLLCEVKHFFPETARLVVYIFKTCGDSEINKRLKTELARKLVQMKDKYYPVFAEEASKKEEDPIVDHDGDDDESDGVLIIHE